MRLNTDAEVVPFTIYYDQRSLQIRRPCENTRQLIATAFQGQHRCSGLGSTHGWLGLGSLPAQCRTCGAAI